MNSSKSTGVSYRRLGRGSSEDGSIPVRTERGPLAVLRSYQTLVLVVTGALCLLVTALAYHAYRLNSDLQNLKDEVGQLQRELLDTDVDEWTDRRTRSISATVVQVLPPLDMHYNDYDDTNDYNNQEEQEEGELKAVLPGDYENNLILDTLLEKSTSGGISDDRKFSESGKFGRLRRSADQDDGGKRSRRNGRAREDRREGKVEPPEEGNSRRGRGGGVGEVETTPRNSKRGGVRKGGGIKGGPGHERGGIRREEGVESGMFGRGQQVLAHYEAWRSSPSEKYHVSHHTAPVTLPIWRAVMNLTTPASAEVFDLEQRSGVVTVKHDGLYWVYAQLVYHDMTRRWAFGVFVNETAKLKCITTEQNLEQSGTTARPLPTTSSSQHTHAVYQHCYTAAMLRISRNDKISIRCLYGQKTIVLQPEFTYWGMVRFASV